MGVLECPQALSARMKDAMSRAVDVAIEKAEALGGEGAGPVCVPALPAADREAYIKVRHCERLGILLGNAAGLFSLHPQLHTQPFPSFSEPAHPTWAIP